MALTDIKTKRALIDIVESTYESLEARKKDYTTSYERVGKEEEQATDWRTGELLWEDDEHTIPRYRDKYDLVDKETLDDDDKAHIAAIDIVLKALEKLI